jgi:exopolysaccharide biosynthesis polyprenyl glycosylphosphotransferase
MPRSAPAGAGLIVAAMVLVDAIIVFDAFALAYILRFRFQLLARDYFPPAPVHEYLRAMVVVAYLWVPIFFIAGLYDFRRHRSRIDVVRAVVKAVSFGTILILSLTYFYRDFSFSRLVCVFAWALSIVFFSAFRLAVDMCRRDRHRRSLGLREVAVIGSRALARYLVERIRAQPELGYRIRGLVDSAPPEVAIPDCPYLGSLPDLAAVIDSQLLDGVFIAYPTLGHYELLEVIQVCEAKGVSIRMVPPTYDLLINFSDFEEVDGIPLVKVNEQEYRRVDDVSKRVLDLALAATGAILCLPLWGFIALAIKLDDGGPVFFSQRRIGRNGAPFRMWKFRTMRVDAEARLGELVDVDRLAEPVFKLEADPRVTRAGRWLRRTSLDELPQLINVLRGEMSLVGPRPEEERLVSLYNVWERRRLKALPGITGLQQVECRGHPSLSERVRWDILYLRKRTLLLDLWILVRTPWVVLTGKGAR